MATETVIDPKSVRKVLLSVLLQRSTLGFVTMHNAPRAIIENIKDIEDSYIDIRNTLSKKINQQKHSHIESKKEYYYAVGQLVRYYISLNKSKDKYHSLSNPFINATSDDVIKSKLKQFYKKYNYAIKINNNRYNNLYQMILSYIPSGRVISDDIIAGYISNNLIYESKKSEENN